ncbi:TPA: plasmid mobilization relaxosome protein MobC [Pseudomonas aeruginosa]|nr:plasmid mobilization relaxosome protein MobC [Pseudomonas aeruginosa]HEJ2774749.1 plasmid mobilization relaxosome protein MobC [Pseudomonas aeruginosa]
MSDLFPDKEKKKANRSKGSTITIRTTKKTADAFQELKIKTGLTYEQLIEKIITDGFGLIVEINSPSLKTTYETFEKKISEPYNNLNQIAKHLNSGEVVPEHLWKTLEKIDFMFTTLNGLLRDQKKYVRIEKNINNKE